MVEARTSNQNDESGSENASDRGQICDESVVIDEDVVIKPRNNYSSSALQLVVPKTDLRKKKESLSMSLINIGSSGRSASRMFMPSGRIEGQEEGRHQSFNMIARQISFQSPVGKNIEQVVRGSSNKVDKAVENPIAEVHSDDSDLQSDPSSESSSEDSDSSIEAAINGEEETEQSLYDKIQAAQEGREAGQKVKQEKKQQLDELVDRNMVNLLRVCSMLRRPSEEEIESRKVYLGPTDRSKLLILDMDETLLHSKFHKLVGNEDQMDMGVRPDANGVLEFNALISNKPNQPPSMRLNVKLRQNLEEALSYLSTMYELCVFTAGEQDYADTILNFIDEDRSIIKHRLYRQHCVRPENGVYVKDLAIIADRNIKDMVIVDNSIISFAFNLSSGIPIKAFVGEGNDDELLFMVTYLEEVYTKPDIRKFISQTFKLQEYSERFQGHGVKSKKEERKLIKEAQQSLHVKK